MARKFKRLEKQQRNYEHFNLKIRDLNFCAKNLMKNLQVWQVYFWLILASKLKLEIFLVIFKHCEFSPCLHFVYTLSCKKVEFVTQIFWASVLFSQYSVSCGKHRINLRGMISFVIYLLLTLFMCSRSTCSWEAMKVEKVILR